MIAIGSGQFGQLHTTFSHTHEIRVIYMRLKRKYRSCLFRAYIQREQSCGNLIRRLRADSHLRVRSELSARVGFGGGRGDRRSVRPSVRPIRRSVHRSSVRSHDRCTFVCSHARLFVRSHLGSFVRASAVHSLFFLWPGFDNEVCGKLTAYWWSTNIS